MSCRRSYDFHYRLQHFTSAKDWRALQLTMRTMPRCAVLAKACMDVLTTRLSDRHRAEMKMGQSANLPKKGGEIMAYVLLGK